MPTVKAQLLMTLPVHLVPSLQGIETGSTLQLEGDEAHHAVVVRRLRVGESLVFTDGRGTEAHAVVKATGKRTLDALLTEVRSTPAQTPSLTTSMSATNESISRLISSRALAAGTIAVTDRA